MVTVCHYKYLSGSVIVFSLGLALYGILQCAGIILSSNTKFAIVGSFDNPAGFAAALACALPLCFLFFARQTKYLRFTAIVVAIIMAIAVFLSGSRAGMLSIVVATAGWFLAKTKVTPKLKIALVAALIALPVILYFVKKDSADGRLLIWRCTLDMIADSPVIGQGQGAFQAKYMLYQAAYFEANPDSKYAQLADNTLYPFNEYLQLLTEHGFIGFGVVVLLGFLLVRLYRRNRSNEKLSALMSLLALAVFSFFSYPLRYPFTWVILLLNVAVICYTSNVSNFSSFFSKRKSLIIRNIPQAFVLLLSAGLLVCSVMLTRAEIKWKKVAHMSLAGKIKEVLPQYDELYPWFGNNGFFLYNHAAELHNAKEHQRSIAVFGYCTHYFNDMDVQMLMADNYKKLGKYTEAEQHLRTAAAMCPARFRPLYELVKLYEATDRKDEAISLANIIENKEVKVFSSEIAAIKSEMRRLIDNSMD